MRAFAEDQLGRLDRLALAYAGHSPGSDQAQTVAQGHAELAAERVGDRVGERVGTRALFELRFVDLLESDRRWA